MGANGWTDGTNTMHCFWCWGGTDMTGSYVNSNVDLPMARGSTTPTFEAWITQDDGKAVVAVGGPSAQFTMGTAAITSCNRLHWDESLTVPVSSKSF